MRKTRIRAGIFTLTAVLVTTPTLAGEGDASLRLEYQYIRTGAFVIDDGEVDIGNTDAHVYMLSADYAITDDWTVFASIPWIQKRHIGALPHNAVLDFQVFEPPDRRVVDDGNYHGGWQDIYVGAFYNVVDGPFSVSPFIAYGAPTNNYQFYGHAAIGRNLWHLPVGAAWSYTPYFSDWFFSGDAAYVFTEKTLGVDVSHWLVNLRASYYVTPRFAPKAFVSIKHGTKGLSWPDDFDLTNLDTADFFYHDRTIKHNWINGGIGFDFVVNDKYQLSGTWFKMLDPDQVNEVERAWSFSVTGFFGGNSD